MSKAKVKFKRLSYNAYRMIQQPDIDTLYFILDKPFIYLGKVQYGIILDVQKHLINKVEFDKETNELILGISGTDVPERVKIDINLASEINDGLMSKEQVKQLNEAVKVTSSINEIVSEAIAEATIEPNWNEVV